jgi:hypothetical protein
VSVLWLMSYVGSFFTWRLRFNPRTVRVGYEVDKVALGQAFLRGIRFSVVRIISPVLHSNFNLSLLVYNVSN